MLHQALHLSSANYKTIKITSWICPHNFIDYTIFTNATQSIHSETTGASYIHQRKLLRFPSANAVACCRNYPSDQRVVKQSIPTEPYRKRCELLSSYNMSFVYMWLKLSVSSKSIHENNSDTVTIRAKLLMKAGHSECENDKQLSILLPFRLA